MLSKADYGDLLFSSPQQILPNLALMLDLAIKKNKKPKTTS